MDSVKKVMCFCCHTSRRESSSICMTAKRAAIQVEENKNHSQRLVGQILTKSGLWNKMFKSRIPEPRNHSKIDVFCKHTSRRESSSICMTAKRAAIQVEENKNPSQRLVGQILDFLGGGSKLHTSRGKDGFGTRQRQSAAVRGAESQPAGQSQGTVRTLSG